MNGLARRNGERERERDQREREGEQKEICAWRPAVYNESLNMALSLSLPPYTLPLLPLLIHYLFVKSDSTICINAKRHKYKLFRS